MSETLNLLTLDEAGFERLYEERIKPGFVAHEAERIAAVATYKQRLVFAVSGALLAFALMVVLAHEVQFGIFAAAAVLLGGWAWADAPLRGLRRTVKARTCESIAAAIGVAYQIDCINTVAIPRYRTLDLLPSYDRIHFDDRFAGVYVGARFEMFEAHLEREHRDDKGRTSWSTIFRGQCLVLSFPRQFLGTTIVRRDSGPFNFLGGGGPLKKVSLEDPVFEKAFEVFSTDQVEARYLLHPMFTQRLVDLEALFKGERLRCAFDHGDLLIAIEGGNLFEAGSMFKPLADPERARKIVNDVSGVLRVMDSVLTAQALRS